MPIQNEELRKTLLGNSTQGNYIRIIHLADRLVIDTHQFLAYLFPRSMYQKTRNRIYDQLNEYGISVQTHSSNPTVYIDIKKFIEYHPIIG